ncbi:spartin-like [Paramisgurnus dabryanus]|uniref:spartin-like n=1 Tax=Paramisgurnus dabryanus TaxID=90735 RepID=UPI0031F3707D
MSMAPTQYDKMPKPGNLIEIFRVGYQHWAIYIDDGFLIHLGSDSEYSKVGSCGTMSVPPNIAIVKQEKLQNVVGNDKYHINNLLDYKYKPRPFSDIIKDAKGLVGTTVSYNPINRNCEHFVTELRYGKPECLQVSDDAEYTINLGQKVPMGTAEAALSAAEGETVLPEWSEKVAQGIQTGASWLSWGLVKGAEYTGKAIHNGASKLREHITPEDTPIYVSPTVTKSLSVAKQATEGTVKVSQFLVDGLCTVAGHVGREVAPHVKKQGEKLIPDSVKNIKDGCSNIDGAMVVVASGFQGFATTWTGLVDAAKTIAKSVATETVTTVEHKYGAAAGQATDHAVNSAINVGIAATNINHLGIKAMVKKTGKETAHAILADYEVNEQGSEVEKHKEYK